MHDFDVTYEVRYDVKCEGVNEIVVDHDVIVKKMYSSLNEVQRIVDMVMKAHRNPSWKERCFFCKVRVKQASL